MMERMTKQRTQVELADRWNVEALFKNNDEWNAAFSEHAPKTSPRWPAIAALKGRLHEGPEVLKQALDTITETDRALAKISTYSHLKHDEDIADSQFKALHSEATAACHEFMQEIAWFEPELLALPSATMTAYLHSPHLAAWRFHLEKIFRMKPHTLNEEQETLLAMTAKALSTSYKAFNALSDADFKFPSVLDKDGAPHELTHARYQMLLRSPDATLRENGFKGYLGTYQSYENTLAELLNGQVEAHVFNARARKFKSSLEAALFPKNIPVSVYHALIQAVHEEIDALHRYMEIRSKALKIKPLHIYDLQIPLTPAYDMKIPYTQAEELVVQATAPLGSEYQNILKNGLLQERWVDRYENLNKRSGAYSSGCYDSMPYILMNYKEIVRDLFTLSHEAGHSMHSYFSRKTQPYQYSDYSIFVAEVASTFNEELLLQMMLKNAKSKDERIFLLTQKIDDIRGTLFRQTQFAEFELLIHTLGEQNVPLTPQRLSEEYLKLNRFYYGSSLADDPEIAIEWARIPHFYYNFYVYQYATGISAALALAERVLGGGTQEREDYLKFLKSGSSLYPIDALKVAGVDMTSVAPVKQAIKRFRSLCDALEKEISS
jgi:oligoendopeptidase F